MRSPAWSGLVPYLYVAPALAVLGVFVFLPAVLVFLISLFRWSYGTHPVWAGLGQYALVLGSSAFWQSAWISVLFAGGTVVVGTALALMVALGLYGNIRGRGALRTLYFVPYVMPVVATATVWLWIFQPQYGILDQIITRLGGPMLGWVQSPNLALVSLMIFTIWYTLGFTTLLFLAGLTNISPEVLEAARVDGAGSWTTFRRMIWPLLSPTTLFVLIINTISTFQSFTQIYALTRGGPLNATTTLTYYLYQTAFQYFHFGQGAAVGVVLFLFLSALTGIQLLVTRRWVEFGQ